MIRHLTLIIFFFIISNSIVAQQMPQYSLYMLNPFAQNPAYAGLDNTLSATGVYRTQWTGLTSNPVTQVANAHLPLYIINSGVGIQLENEELGAFQKTTASLSYSYQIPLGKKNILSVGISGGLSQETLDGTLLRTPDGDYNEEQNILVHNDDLLPTEKINSNTVNFAAGVYYQSNSLEIGLGVLNLQEPSLDFNTFSKKLERNYYLTASYKLDLNRTLTLKPSILIKSDIKQMQAEVSALVDYKNKIFLGLSYRGFVPNSRDAFVPLGGLKLNENWTIGYAYDITLSSLNTVSNGSHEIILNYNFGKPIGKGSPPKIIYNPRF